MTDSDNILDEWFPRDAGAYLTDAAGGAQLGVVVGGSLSKGLAVRLSRDVRIEDLAVGRYVVVQGVNKRFFCMITDITLDNTNPSIESDPPNIADQFLDAVYTGTAVYGTISVAPMLSIEGDGVPKPVKTIPGHFRPVFNATEQDVNDVFGHEDETHFNVGAPLELEETQINLDLQRLVERSVGVFGKSGTGKSFLTRLILAGVITRKQAVNLIFDMHNDYGWEVTDERGYKVKGLKQLFPSDVSIITLDDESTRRRGAKADFEVKLGFNEIEPEDIAMLKGTMSLSDTMIDAAYTLKKEWGDGWIPRLLDGHSVDIEDIEANTNILRGTLIALQRRLERFERWGFLTPESSGDSVKEIIHLLEQGKTVVLEFGRYGNSLEAYILVANYLTRRIHHLYVEKVETALGDTAMEPPQLLITIEEAHKFLDPLIARQTIFGIIARELRKYNVTLLIVDQRPSQIDEEVLSQIGTRVTALLDNERDISAVLTGISGSSGLREVLARLDTKQQAIIMGHAVPMPVVVRTRSYDEAFYDAMMGGNGRKAKSSRARKRLGSGDGDRRIR
ncbi:MAG: ATP-binding protein [Chloroflexi bacterium]|nr:MAG: ATPase [Phototrophicales bacterium]RMF79928.1 MAG: ATP-binding protein [Chloroflexota bacterium]